MRALAHLTVCLLIVPASLGLAYSGSESEPAEILFEEDFEETKLDAWTMTDPDAWRVASIEDSNAALELHRNSDYQPSVRSPLNIALIPDLTASSFVLDLKARSTERDYGHRDLCVFFNYEDPSHFYYVHLGKEADPHAHSIFLVDGAPRVSIADERTDGTPWSDDWHRVRIVRDAESGRIDVYFDDFDTPIMTAHDRTFTRGRIGVGSFDDVGQFDDVTVRTLPSERP